MSITRPTLIDFFCGAGGFSEGFRQQGFMILKGYDKWKPAIDTFNHNFGKGKGEQLNILDLESEDKIRFIENEIPDSHVIVGSPPCVSFSSSNRSGKADKALGLRLIKTFLKIVAIKKHKKGSILKAWFMENVSKSKDHVKDHYTFKELGLEIWAKKRKLSPNSIAIKLKTNTQVLNAADYGSPQIRFRAISGEIVKFGTFVSPTKNLSECDYVTLGFIRSKLPSPISKADNRKIVDPLYCNIAISQTELTDHFYDSGLYESIWKNSKHLKCNHPYMGRMSFPENEKRPSRTVTATNIGSSREAIIYRSEYDRIGHGEFRTPTVREVATLMSFPITFQFVGTEGTKWKMIGNAVCPSISRALASMVRENIGVRSIIVPIMNPRFNINGVNNLNTFRPKPFDHPPKKNKGSRFRRHPFKYGNITITLSNYNIVGAKHQQIGKRWITSAQYGNGEGFPHQDFEDGFYEVLEPFVSRLENGSKFIEIINNGFSEKIASAELLQRMHEEQCCFNNYLEPSRLVEEVAHIVDKFHFQHPLVEEAGYLGFKTQVPKKQVLALYAINRIATVANSLTTSARQQ
jgi:DNA (cytosine-5)-methyltransferase 1